jgi:hypothetical protein
MSYIKPLVIYDDDLFGEENVKNGIEEIREVDKLDSSYLGIDNTNTVNLEVNNNNNLDANVNYQSTSTINLDDDTSGLKADLNSTLKSNYDTAYSHTSNTSNPHSVTKTQVGLSNVDNVQQMPLSYLDIDNTLSNNSDVKVSSQKAIKYYVDHHAGGVTAHSALTQLDYASAGHTGFEPTVAKGNLSEITSSILTITGGTGSIIGTGTTIQVKQSSSIQDGYLSSTNWSTFNGKYSGLPSQAGNNGKFLMTDGNSESWGTPSGVSHDPLTLASPDSGLSLTGQVLALGTPSTVTNATTNSVTTNTHTHALTGVEPTLTKGNLSEATSSILTITGGTGAIIGSGTTIEVKQSSNSISGYLSNTDWGTFNGKENALTFSYPLSRSTNTISLLYDTNTLDVNVSNQLKVKAGVYQAAGTYVTSVSGSSPISSSGGTTPSISIADATTSVKGATQLSNSYNGTSQTLAVTEKALSDGLSSVSGHAAVTLFTDSGLTLTGQQIGMGTPSSITISSTNSISTNTHTHAITGYILSNGLSGGQTLYGGTEASENLTLYSTYNATKGNILFGTSCYDEVNNRLGIGITSPTNTISMSGQAVTKIWTERNTTSNTAGNSLTIEASGAASGATDKNGGSLIFRGGIATGTGYQSTIFQSSVIGSTGTTDNSFVETMRIRNNRLGIGTTNPSYKIHANQTLTDSTANATSYFLDTTYKASTGDVTVTEDGVTFNVYANTNSSAPYYNHTASVRALIGSAYNSGSGDLTDLRGLVFSGGCLGTGNITNFTAAQIGTYGTGAGIITTATGLSIVNMNAYNTPVTSYAINIATNNTANGTSKYGLYVNNISGATNNFSIYTNNGLTYFGDKVGILNTPTAYLDLPASVSTAASLRIRSGAATSSPTDGECYYDGTHLYFRSGGWNDLLTIGGGHAAVTVVDSSSIDFTLSTQQITAVVLPAGVDHNSLANLATGNYHTQYVLLAGAAGGQTVYGGTAASNSLTLLSSSNATKGLIKFGTLSCYDEVNDRIGITTLTPSYNLSLGGNAVKTIAMERHTTSNTAGNNLTMAAGPCTSGATDKNGGSLIFAPGTSSGTGTTLVKVQSYSRAQTTGTTDNSPYDVTIWGPPVFLTKNVATAIFDVDMSTYKFSSGIIYYGIEVTNETDYMSYYNHTTYAAYNKSGTPAAPTTGDATARNAVSTGSLTVTISWTTAANKITFKINANPSITPTYIICRWKMDHLSRAVVTPY